MHEEDDAEVRTILERISNYYGFVPRIYQELQRNPEAFKAFFYKNEQLATDMALPGLTKELIAIGAAAALGSEYCLGTHIEGAKRSAHSKIRSFSRYCLEPASPIPQRYPNPFARGSVEVRPQTSRFT